MLDRSALECIGMAIKRLPRVELHTENAERVEECVYIDFASGCLFSFFFFLNHSFQIVGVFVGKSRQRLKILIIIDEPR